jgi:hypothetical protein
LGSRWRSNGAYLYASYRSGLLFRSRDAITKGSVMKNFLIAIVLAVILVNCLGSVIDDWFGMHIVMSDELLSPWENLAALSVIGVLLAVVGFVVAVSVLGTLLLAVGAVFLALLAAGIGAFWPIVVLAILIYAFKDKSKRDQHLNRPV